MKIYVAAASAELHRATGAMTYLRAHGHEVVGDWTQDVAELGANTGLSDTERRRAVHLCVSGILGADAIVLLWPKTETRGAWIEFGIALGLGKGFAEPPVYTVGARKDDTVFYEMATKHFERLGHLVEWLEKGATNAG